MVKPVIDDATFGAITVAGETYSHDVMIRLNGEVRKRKKKLSKKHYGTSHKLSLEEAEFIWEDGADLLIIGNGQSGQLQLTEDAEGFFNEKGCQVLLDPTPDALKRWNATIGNVIGLFHVTC